MTKETIPSSAAIYEVKAGDLESNLVLPKQNITDSDKTPAWHLNMARYVCTFYNRPVRNVAIPNEVDLDQNRTGNQSGSPFNGDYFPVNEMLKYMLYYLGKQPNVNYNHLTQNVTTSNLQTNWIKGQKISQIVDNLCGNVRSRVSNASWSVKTLSREASSARTDMFKKLMLKQEMGAMFKDLEGLGVSFNPANGKQFESPEAIDEWINKGGYKDINAELATDIAKGLWHENYWVNKAIETGKHVVVAGVCAMQNYVDRGKVRTKVINPYQLIIDRRKDEDYNREARFIGVIENLTPNEIIARYPGFTETQKQELYDTAKNQELGKAFNTTQNITWWNYGAVGGNGTVAVVTTYWIGPHILNRRVKENRYGNKKVVKIENSEVGDYEIEDVHKATLIGNRYVVDFGYMDNVTEDVNDKRRPMLPIKVYMPQMTLGETRSIVARLHQLQDEKDMIKFKISEMIGRASGKNYVVMGDKLGANINSKTLIEDFKSMGISVLTTSGEDGGDVGAGGIVETVDMTLDPNIQQLVGYMDKLDAMMEEIASTSKIALGQQTSYIGQATQQSTIGQSALGLAPLLDGFMDFLQITMQDAVNMAKMIYTMDDNFTADVVIGDKGRLFLKGEKKFRFEDLLCILQINDIVDEAGKQRLITSAQAALQNSQIDFIDYIRIEAASTYSEMLNDLEYATKKKKKEQEEAEKRQAMQAAMSQDAQLSSMEAIAQEQSNAGLQKNQQNLQGKMDQTVLQDVMQQGKQQAPVS